jgi:hypothetical protein
MIIQDEGLLADIACIEPVAVDGLFGLVNLGETFLTCFYRWRAVKWENGVLVREKVISLVISRPRTSLISCGCFDRWLVAQPSAQAAAEPSALSH